MAGVTYPKFNWDASNLAEELRIFKRQFELCLEDAEVVSLSRAATKLKLAIGAEGLRRLDASGLTEQRQSRCAPIWNLLQQQLNKHINYRVHRLELSTLRFRPTELIDDFVNRCRDKARACDFTPHDLDARIQELVIATTPISAFQKELLSKDNTFTLDDMLQLGRRYEAIQAGTISLQNLLSDSTNVDAFRNERHGSQRRPTARPQPNTPHKACGNCGRKHAPKSCPASNDTCGFCHNLGHWNDFCRKRDRTNYSENTQRTNPPLRPTRRHDEVTFDDRDDVQYMRSFSSVDIAPAASPLASVMSEVFTTLDIQPPGLPGSGYTLKLKVDTGACGNTLPLRTYKQMYPRGGQPLTPAPHLKLTAYNGGEIPCMGSISMPCKRRESAWTQAVFYVVDVPGPAIVGLPTSKLLRLVTINVDGVNQDVPETITSVQDLKRRYPKQFDTIGNFEGPAKLLLKDGAEPFTDAPRKCSIHLKDKLRAELDKMEEQGIIRKVEEHTDWCSSLAFTTKKNGSLRICLDPQRLNANLKRCPHKIPTVEELNPQFSGAKFFSKLDAKAGYWSVHLDEESQLLTTFRTVFGRYCWRRLPFGLSTSQDIFQARMDIILEGLPGVVSIADDVCIIGTTEAIHDANLMRLMDRAVEKGLVFNSAK